MTVTKEKPSRGNHTLSDWVVILGMAVFAIGVVNSIVSLSIHKLSWAPLAIGVLMLLTCAILVAFLVCIFNEDRESERRNGYTWRLDIYRLLLGFFLLLSIALSAQGFYSGVFLGKRYILWYPLAHIGCFVCFFVSWVICGKVEQSRRDMLIPRC